MDADEGLSDIVEVLVPGTGILNMESKGGGKFPVPFNDRVLTKSNHRDILMMEEAKKYIIALRRIKY